MSVLQSSAPFSQDVGQSSQSSSSRFDEFKVRGENLSTKGGVLILETPRIFSIPIDFFRRDFLDVYGDAEPTRLSPEHALASHIFGLDPRIIQFNLSPAALYGNLLMVNFHTESQPGVSLTKDFWRHMGKALVHTVGAEANRFKRNRCLQPGIMAPDLGIHVLEPIDLTKALSPMPASAIVEKMIGPKKTTKQNTKGKKPPIARLTRKI